MDRAIFLNHGRNAGKIAPLIRSRRPVAYHLQMIGTRIKSKPQRNRPGGTRRALQPLTTRMHVLNDLIENRYFADMVEANGRVVVSEWTARHDTEQKHTRLIVKPCGDVKVGKGRAEQVVDVGDLVQHSVY